MKIDPNFFDAPSHPVADEAAFDTSPDWTKRYADVILVTLSLPVTAPVIGALWLVVRLDGGAGFYRQKRLPQLSHCASHRAR
jgi:lipopolysaccharide/colanic/teichoic acid biosynthesis glycosyltransferase